MPTNRRQRVTPRARRSDDPDDLHLWTEVSRTVRPLPSRGHAASHDNPKRGAATTDGRHAAAADADSVPARDPDRAVAKPAAPGATSAKPIDRNLQRKIARGREHIDATLDLHGMRQDAARTALVGFIKSAAARGHRNVLIITGKGRTGDAGGPHGPRGVLRTVVPGWLAGPSLSPMIAGLGTAGRAHGGDGAIYVRLKRVIP